jgi:hypothetical protein
LGGSAIGTGLGFGAASLAARTASKNCREEPVGEDEVGSWCGLHAGLTGAFTFLLTAPAFATLGSYFTHHSLGGDGRWWMGMLGSGLGLGVGLAGLLIATGTSDSHAAAMGGLTALGVAVATLPVVFLEIDHAHREHAPAARAKRRTWAASATPVAGGVMLGLAGRL